MASNSKCCVYVAISDHLVEKLRDDFHSANCLAFRLIFFFFLHFVAILLGYILAKIRSGKMVNMLQCLICFLRKNSLGNRIILYELRVSIDLFAVNIQHNHSTDPRHVDSVKKLVNHAVLFVRCMILAP